MSGAQNDAGRARLQDAIRSIRRLQGRVAELENAAREPIAIIGAGCRFPGKVAGPDDYWRLLENGVNAVGEVPPERWDVQAWYDPDPDKPGKMYTTAGGFLEGVDLFDADLFGFSPREAAKMDPQHRLVLEVAWEALEHAGLPPRGLGESATGVYLGITAFDYGLHLSELGGAYIDAYSMTGTKLNFAAGRIAYALGLQGPAFAVDTACSSSLTALHLACQALRRDDCELALAGGVNAMLTPEQTVAECKARMLSPEGRCKAFDAGADGFVRGEGCGMLVLERLSRAEREGHPVIAVIRGTAVNQDGATSGPTVPNRLAQEAVIRRALADAGLGPDDIDYVEAHGTGTPLGDPIEVRALANVFHGRKTPLRIGSVKTNFGHLESAAGIAGVLKAALGVQHGVIPPHLNVRALTQAVDWDNIPVEVATVRTAWPETERPRRAGISSFGASGTNAHIVLEQAPPQPETASVERSCYVYPVSAASEHSLAATAGRHAAALTGVANFADAGRTAGAGRSHLQHRLAVLGNSADVRRTLAAFAGGERDGPFRAGTHTHAPRVAFLLPGRLGDARTAGRDLYASQPEFTERIDVCAGLAHLALPELLFANDTSDLHRPRHAEPALFALQYALAGLWQAFGIVPQVLFGCGTGEYVAACLAGALSVEDAMRLAVARGRLLESLADGGAMAAVAADAAEVSAVVAAHERVSVAAINSENDFVVSGAQADVDRVVAALARNGAQARKLDGAPALQSPLVDPLLGGFAGTVGDLTVAAPRVKLVSSIEGAPLPRGTRPDLAYWRRQLRDTVQFGRAVQALASDRVDVCLELGPDAAMSRRARRCLPTARVAWTPSLAAGGDDWRAVCEAVGTLYVAGADIEWKNVYRGASGTTVRLPTYAFEHKRHWVDPPAGRKATGVPAATDTGHPLLGVRLASPLAARQYATTFNADRPRWLADHKVFGRVIVPATAYLEMLLAAARDAAGPDAFIRDVFIHAPIAVDDDTPAAVQTLVEPDGDGYRLRIVGARADGGWTEHVSARAERSGHESPLAAESFAGLSARISRPVPIDTHYRAMSDSGVEFGPAFRSVGELWRGDAESLGHVRAADGVSLDGDDGCWLHPALLDGCLQVAREALPESARAQRDGALVPMQVARFSVHARPRGNLVCHARLTNESDGTYELALHIADEGDVTVATIEGLRLARLDRGKLAATEAADAEPDTYRLEWRPKPQEARAAAPGTHWLVVAHDDALAERCAAELRRDYERVHLVRASRQLAIDAAGDSAVRVGEPNDFRQVVAATVGTGGPWIVVHAGGSIGGAEPDEQAVRHAQALYLQSLLHTAQALEASAADAKLIVMTHAAQGASGVSGLSAASLWGLGRVLQNELPRLGTVLLDLHDLDAAPRQLAAEAGAADGENQVLYRDGERHVARLTPAASEAGHATGPARLVLDTPGLPDSLALRPMTRPGPRRGEVEIEVTAAGLNFRDVLVALGVYQGPAGPLGGECAGTVVAVGEGVDAFDVGDRVLAFATGAMASHVVTDARLAWRTPAALPDADAATLPIAFLTAAYCLDHLARLARGERVLIHGAAGGVGMAAVQLARRAGAEIFGTAGTEDKRSLIRSLGVDHALDSRSLDFADEILRLTGGAGVDVVLNSLAGDFIPASLRAAAQGARFLEIGRTDIWSPEDVARVRADVEYRAVLLGDTCESDPALIQEIGAGLVAAVAEGSLSALPRRTWPMRRAADAFRLMARAGHTGKLVLVNDAAPVRRDGAYLVTGGFGGLGLELARWLAAQGAGTIALLGRRAADARVQSVIDELSAAGATVLALTADVTDEADLRRALAEVGGTGHPLCGVFHAAGTLDDGIVAEQTWQRVQSVLDAKVTGALLLHKLTAELPLDLFVLFSSASAIFGAAGQGGYAAGNAFMDALARWRAQRGLPALSVNWGPWSDAGMFAESGAAGRRAVLERGFRSLPAGRNLAALQALLEARVTEAGVFVVDWAAYRAARADGAPLAAELSRSTASPAPERGAFAAELERAPAPRRRPLLRDRIRAEVAGVLGNTADAVRTSQGFREQGMDSLMSVELRNRLERLLGRPLVSTLAFDHPNVEALADHLLSDMFAPAAGAAPPSSAPRDEIAAEVDELTDEEAEELLALELQRMSRADGVA